MARSQHDTLVGTRPNRTTLVASEKHVFNVARQVAMIRKGPVFIQTQEKCKSSADFELTPGDTMKTVRGFTAFLVSLELSAILNKTSGR